MPKWRFHIRGCVRYVAKRARSWREGRNRSAPVVSGAQLLCHAIAGLLVEAPGDEHMVLTTERVVAHVNFCELNPVMPEVVELNIIPTSATRPLFQILFQFKKEKGDLLARTSCHIIQLGFGWLF